jgi:hypothetical protein
MSNRRRASTPVNGTGHDSFTISRDGYGRMHLVSGLPKVVSITHELWAAIEPGLPWATIDLDDLTVRTVETTFTYRRVNGQTDGKRTVWVCELAQQHPTNCTCPAGRYAVATWHTPDCPLSPTSFT